MERKMILYFKASPEDQWAVILPSKFTRLMWWGVLGSFWRKSSPYFFLGVKSGRLQIKGCSWSWSSNRMPVQSIHIRIHYLDELFNLGK